MRTLRFAIIVSTIAIWSYYEAQTLANRVTYEIDYLFADITRALNNAVRR